MSAINVGGELVHYEVLGRGRTVILLHGWLGSWRYWIPLMRQLQLRYRVYAVDLFAEDTPQFDDITLLALEYRGGEVEERRGERFVMSLTAAELVDAPVGEHVHRFLEPVGLSDSALRDVRLLLDELLTNSVQHGLKGSTRPTIHVELHVTGDTCEITLRDNGMEFDPTGAPPVDTDAALEDRDIGGLGVHICRQVADDVSYRRALGENIVKLTKRFSAPVLPAREQTHARAAS